MLCKSHMQVKLKKNEGATKAAFMRPFKKLNCTLLYSHSQSKHHQAFTIKHLQEEKLIRF